MIVLMWKTLFYCSPTENQKKLKNEKNIKIIGVAAGDVSSYRSNIESWASSPELVFETGLTKLEVAKNVDKLVGQLKDPLCKETGK